MTGSMAYRSLTGAPISIARTRPQLRRPPKHLNQRPAPPGLLRSATAPQTSSSSLSVSFGPPPHQDHSPGRVKFTPWASGLPHFSPFSPTATPLSHHPHRRRIRSPISPRSYCREMSTSTVELASQPCQPLPNVGVTFETTPVEGHAQPLGPGRTIRTAACLIIGDEILNGKTKDSNSNFFAKFCFDNGIELKRIEVIADDEAEIVEAVRRMVDKYDLVITSGGIGPTHDDITYASLAKAFSLPLKHHEETIRRMAETYKNREGATEQNAEQKTARDRMALFPSGEGAEVLFTAPELWVPVVRLQGKLCIFPGVPRLFERMMVGLKPYLPLPSRKERPFRYLVHTMRAESSIAPFLTALQNRVTSEHIQVGSYPRLESGVTVSLIGKDQDRLVELGKEVVEELEGTVVASEEDVNPQPTNGKI